MWVLIALGGVLQIFGLGAAAIGVRATRKAYAPQKLGLGGWMRQIAVSLLSGIRRHPKRAPSEVASPSSADVATTAEQAYVLKGPPRDGTPEEREEYLLDQVVDLQKQCIALHQELTSERQQRETVVSELAEAVTHQEGRALAAIAKAKTDGLGLEAFGLFCVVLGVVLATVGSLT